jgi:hypothetical protein
MHATFWSENLKERDHAENRGVDGKIILECVLENIEGICRLDVSGIAYRPAEGSCEHENKPSSSM